jgi:hypothetical protein
MSPKGDEIFFTRYLPPLEKSRAKINFPMLEKWRVPSRITRSGFYA